MKKISTGSPFNLKNILEEYKLNLNSMVSHRIGFDERIYLLFNENVPNRIVNAGGASFVNTQSNSKYSAVILDIDWEMKECINSTYINLGIHEMNYHFLQPFGENILLLGCRCYYNNGKPELNCSIVGRDGCLIKSGCLGDGIADVITTDDGKIITSYFDEGVFGNYGWNNPVGSHGLVVWSGEFEKVWEAEYDICDCYAINEDDAHNLWFYYYTDFKLVKTNYEKDVVFNPDIRGANSFMISLDGRHVIMDSGYDKHGQFKYIEISNKSILNQENLEFEYNGSLLVLKNWIVRGSKAVLIDNKFNMYFIKVVSL